MLSFCTCLQRALQECEPYFSTRWNSTRCGRQAQPSRWGYPFWRIQLKASWSPSVSECGLLWVCVLPRRLQTVLGVEGVKGRPSGPSHCTDFLPALPTREGGAQEGIVLAHCPMRSWGRGLAPGSLLLPILSIQKRSLPPIFLTLCPWLKGERQLIFPIITLGLRSWAVFPKSRLWDKDSSVGS